MNRKITYEFLNRLPQNFVSRSFGALSDIEFPQPVQKWLNKGFAEFASIDLQESERDAADYASLNAFFTRKLQGEVHQIEVTEENRECRAISPVDGRLDQFGTITNGSLIQAKGRMYTVRQLLDSYEHAETFEHGSFATLYLSPKDYHRVHSPVDGTITEVSYIPGRLWPVKPWAVQHVDQLFAVNERLITYIETKAFGRVASVMVGATCVGRMTLSFGDFTTNTSFRRREDTLLQEPLDIRMGDELGCFNLGSTVILLFEKEVIYPSRWEVGSSIRMGNQLAQMESSS